MYVFAYKKMERVFFFNDSKVPNYFFKVLLQSNQWLKTLITNLYDMGIAYKRVRDSDHNTHYFRSMESDNIITFLSIMEMGMKSINFKPNSRRFYSKNFKQNSKKKLLETLFNSYKKNFYF